MVAGYNEGNYIRDKAGVEYDYGAQSANNAYGRFLSQQRGSRSLGDLNRNFGYEYPTVRARLANRGMGGAGISSGVQQESMDRYIGGYLRDYGRTQQDVTQELQQYDLSQMNLDAYRQQALAAIEAQKASDIANAATNLEWLRDLVGGL